MTQSTLLYDETCGFCTTVVQWVSRQKRGDQIRVVPCQFAVLTGSHPVSETDCLASIQLFSSEGDLATKGQAVARVMGILWNARWPEQVARVPGIRHLLDLGYTFIAVNRHRLPGIKQMCSSGGASSSCGSEKSMK